MRKRSWTEEEGQGWGESEEGDAVLRCLGTDIVRVSVTCRSLLAYYEERQSQSRRIGHRVCICVCLCVCVSVRERELIRKRTAESQTPVMPSLPPKCGSWCYKIKGTKHKGENAAVPRRVLKVTTTPSTELLNTRRTLCSATLVANKRENIWVIRWFISMEALENINITLLDSWKILKYV